VGYFDGGRASQPTKIFSGKKNVNGAANRVFVRLNEAIT
jgi:hypothetical protein